MLVRTAAIQELSDAEKVIVADLESLQPVIEGLLTPLPRNADWKAQYLDLQTRAHAALGHASEPPDLEKLLEEPTEPAITWWCDRCDGVDAPQPCLGICVWRTVDWTKQNLYTELRSRLIAKQETERRLRLLVKQITRTVPLPGQHRRNWSAFRAQAERALPWRQPANGAT